MWRYISRSTLKREAASILMLWLIGMTTYLVFIAPTWEEAYKLLEDYRLIIPGIFTAAFGADFVAKQTNIAGPPTQAPKDEEVH